MLHVERIQLPDYTRTLGGRTVREQGDRIYVIEERAAVAVGRRAAHEEGPAAWRVALLVLGWVVWSAVVWRTYWAR